MRIRTSEPNRTRILVVEDDQEMRALLRDELSDEGYEVIQAKDGAEGIMRIRDAAVHLVITDMKMASGGGMELLAAAKQFDSSLPVIMITAFGDWPTLVEAYDQGVYDFISKPFKMQELKQVVKRALRGVKI